MAAQVWQPIRCSTGQAAIALHDALYRQFDETTGGATSYPLPIRVEPNQATSVTRWDGLSRFLDDGRIDLDSNAVERSIKPLAMNR